MKAPEPNILCIIFLLCMYMYNYCSCKPLLFDRTMNIAMSLYGTIDCVLLTTPISHAMCY